MQPFLQCKIKVGRGFLSECFDSPHLLLREEIKKLRTFMGNLYTHERYNRYERERYGWTGHFFGERPDVSVLSLMGFVVNFGGRSWVR